MEQIIAFLEKQVNGKTVRTEELVYELEQGLLQGVYSDRMSFCNLRYHRLGVQMDLFVVSSERIYAMEGERRVALRTDFSGVSLFRFALAKRNSSGRVTGSFRCISATVENTVEGIVSGIYDVELKENGLCFREDQALYRDQPVQDGFKAVAFQAEQQLFVEEGKLHYIYQGKSFNVDPDTLKRGASADHFPAFHSVEI